MRACNRGRYVLDTRVRNTPGQARAANSGGKPHALHGASCSQSARNDRIGELADGTATKRTHLDWGIFPIAAVYAVGVQDIRQDDYAQHVVDIGAADNRQDVQF
jgi:hypothetical protein